MGKIVHQCLQECQRRNFGYHVFKKMVVTSEPKSEKQTRLIIYFPQMEAEPEQLLGNLLNNLQIFRLCTL